LYDDDQDPYQTNNLVAQPASSLLQSNLESQLQTELLKRGDTFLDAQPSLDLWGFTNVPVGSSLPYYDGVQAQAPFSDYDRWAASFNLSGVRTPETLYEYGVGANPTNSTIPGYVPALVNSSTGLQYVYARRRAANSSVVYTIEATESLASPDWTQYPGDEVGVGVLNVEFNTVTNRVSATKSQYFLRLVVQ
jgi:hypothetical protein